MFLKLNVKSALFENTMFDLNIIEIYQKDPYTQVLTIKIENTQ